jgi:ABC-type phosphonate transport system ATPase subunit
VSGGDLESAVEASLRAVNLWNNKVGDKQARQYSGGMKRRLSVAISFTGNPLVVYLDEPSTVRGGGEGHCTERCVRSRGLVMYHVLSWWCFAVTASCFI